MIIIELNDLESYGDGRGQKDGVRVVACQVDPDGPIPRMNLAQVAVGSALERTTKGKDVDRLVAIGTGR